MPMNKTYAFVLIALLAGCGSTPEPTEPTVFVPDPSCEYVLLTGTEVTAVQMCPNLQSGNRMTVVKAGDQAVNLEGVPYLDFEALKKSPDPDRYYREHFVGHYQITPWQAPAR